MHQISYRYRSLLFFLSWSLCYWVASLQNIKRLPSLCFTVFYIFQVVNVSFTQVSRTQIREIPDHATLRGKGANTAWLDKLGLFPSLALCN